MLLIVHLNDYRINACTDLIVKGTEVFKALNVKPSAQADHPELNSLVDLQDGFHYHFKRGTAAERPFTHAEEFKRLVKVASSLEKSSVSIISSLLLLDVVACVFESLDWITKKFP